MKKLISAFIIIFTLAGCSGELSKLRAVYTIVTEATVSPQAVLVAANAFNAIEGTATQYLIYCKSNLSTSACSADNRRGVIKYVRTGRAARNQLEASIATNASAPSAIYNTLVAAINFLNAAPITIGSVK